MGRDIAFGRPSYRPFGNLDIGRIRELLAVYFLLPPGARATDTL